MTRTAEGTALSAEAVNFNRPGYCLQWCRERADIDSRYAWASTAWRYATNKHYDHDAPRGAMVYWTGGPHGYGHIAVSIGHGMIRSTDAGGAGNVETVPIRWIEETWHLRYAGWADNVNGVTIPGVGDDDEMTEPEWDRMRNLVRQEVNAAVDAAVAPNGKEAAKQVWDKLIEVTDNSGQTVTKAAKALLRQIWQRTD